MRRKYLLLLFLLSFLCVQAQEERVYSVSSVLSIDSVGTTEVTEFIRIYSKGKLFKNGFTRPLPLTRQDWDGHKIPMTYEICAAWLDDEPTDFNLDEEGEQLMVFVGDPARFLSSGFHTFTIKYTALNSIGFYEDFDEISWALNAPSDMPIDTVNSVVILPPNVKYLWEECYISEMDSLDHRCYSTLLRDSASIYAEALNVAPNEVVSASVAFSKGLLPPLDSDLPVPNTFFDKYGLLIVTIILLAILLPYYVVTWRKYGRDPEMPTIIPLFNAPEGLSPACAGMMYREKFLDNFVTSSIVNLAIKGYLQIKDENALRGLLGTRKSRAYGLKKLKAADSSLPEEEKVIMNDLFANKNDEIILDGIYNYNVANMLRHYKASVHQQFMPLLTSGKNKLFLIFPRILLPIYFFFLLYFASFEPTDQIGYFVVSVVVSCLIIGLIAFLLTLIFKKSKVKWKRYVLGAALIISSVVLIFLFFHNLSANSIAFVIGFPLVIATYMAYIYLIKQPSPKKLEYQAQVKGLKMYLDATEGELRFFNPPTMTPEVFESLLPYAIALDVEDVWGQKLQAKISTTTTSSLLWKIPWFVGNILDPFNFVDMLINSFSMTLVRAATEVLDGAVGGLLLRGSDRNI